MYTEIVKIIEGGLKKDIKKVYSYAKLLSDKLKEDGDLKMATLITSLLDQKLTNSATLDELVTQTPVDQDSRMSIADVYLPDATPLPLVLSPVVASRVQDFVDSIQHRAELVKRGVDASNTLLLYGLPGVGKTSVAKHISQQTGLPLVIARLDAIVSSLLGNTAKNIRKIFEFADSKPCILFLDEFDAIAKSRDDQHEMGELKRVINSLLQNIDAYAQSNVLIAATNHAELLDRAIWRRFSTVIEIAPPTQEEIVGLMRLFTSEFNADLATDRKRLEKLAELMVGQSPSDIKTIVHRAIRNAILHQQGEVDIQDILIELYDFQRHGKYTLDELVKYMVDSGIPKTQVAEKLAISIRQVRNKLQ